MANEQTPGTSVPALEQAVPSAPVLTPAPVAQPAVSSARPWRLRVVLWGLLAVGGVGTAGAAARYALDHEGEGEPEVPQVKVLSVNTTFPRRETLVRRLEQPGSILPYAQAELYSKASGSLRLLRRDVTPQVAASLAAQPLLFPAAAGASALGQVVQGAGAVAVALWQAPAVDIGSHVSAGEMLMDVEVPDRQQDVVTHEATLRQREEELAQARTVVGTYKAAVAVARAQGKQAEADVKRYRSEYNFRMKELARVKALVRNNAVESRLQDEKQSQADAALAAWESSYAKVQTSQADLALVTSKLATAEADVRVKETEVSVARAAVTHAQILADYGRLHAPFSGVVTFRGVDEGDFVQNSRTGQSRHLMTVTALDKVKVVLQIPSREAVQVRRGAEAILTTDAHPGVKFHGQVSRVRRTMDVQSRTMQAEIDLDNRDGRLMPGMYGHVTVVLRTVPNAWVIPAAALFSRKGVNYVIEVRDGRAYRQPVRILFDDGDQVEVAKLIGNKEVPLDGTEELVVSGKGEIADGQAVRSPHAPAE